MTKSHIAKLQKSISAASTDKNPVAALEKLIKKLGKSNTLKISEDTYLANRLAIAEAYGKLGETHAKLGNYTDASTNLFAASRFLEALNAEKPINDDNLLFNVLNKLGKLHLDNGNYAYARDVFSRAIATQVTPGTDKSFSYFNWAASAASFIDDSKTADVSQITDAINAVAEATSKINQNMPNYNNDFDYLKRTAYNLEERMKGLQSTGERASSSGEATSITSARTAFSSPETTSFSSSSSSSTKAPLPPAALLASAKADADFQKSYSYAARARNIAPPKSPPPASVRERAQTTAERPFDFDAFLQEIDAINLPNQAAASSTSSMRAPNKMPPKPTPEQLASQAATTTAPANAKRPLPTPAPRTSYAGSSSIPPKPTRPVSAAPASFVAAQARKSNMSEATQQSGRTGK